MIARYFFSSINQVITNNMKLKINSLEIDIVKTNMQKEDGDLELK